MPPRPCPLGATPPFPTPVVISCMDVHVPMTTEASIIATYVTGNGSPQVMQEELALPLSLFCQRSLPSKNAAHKVSVKAHLSYVVQHCCSSYLLFSIQPPFLSLPSPSPPPLPLLAQITLDTNKAAVSILSMFMGEYRPSTIRDGHAVLSLSGPGLYPLLQMCIREMKLVRMPLPMRVGSAFFLDRK